MRIRFEEQLESLNEDLLQMSNLCNTAVDRALDCLFEKDKSIIDGVKDMEEEINTYHSGIEDRCLTIIMTQQPVASDLRFVTSALRINTDLERTGDQALDIALLAGEMLDLGYEIRDLGSLKEMAAITGRMLNAALTALRNGDSDLARRAGAMDDQVDKLFVSVREEGICEIRQGSYDTGRVIDGLFIAKYLERIGDHAQNIAEAVLFSLTGQNENLDLL